MRIINLLPKDRQEEIKYEVIFHGWVVLVIMSVAAFACVFLAQFATKFYLVGRMQVLAAEIQAAKQQVNKEENASLKEEIQGINNTISDFKTLAEAAPKWSKAIKAFVKIPPTGVQIKSVSLASAGNTISVSGFSPTRELVIQFYNNVLNDPKEFYNIDYPLENVASPKNISFHFTFNFRPELIK